MTHLRKMMLEELQRRNYAQNTARTYVAIVARFAKHFGRSPEKLGPDQIREYRSTCSRTATWRRARAQAGPDGSVTAVPPTTIPT